MIQDNLPILNSTGIMEGTWCDEHWVLYTTDELLNSTSEINVVLYVG